MKGAVNTSIVCCRSIEDTNTSKKSMLTAYKHLNIFVILIYSIPSGNKIVIIPKAQSIA